MDVATLRRSNAAVRPALAVLAMCPKPVGAEDGDELAKPIATERQGSWSVFAAPKGWLLGVSGIVVTDDEAFEIDVPFEDFFGATRAVLMLYFEARREKLFAGYRVLANDMVTGEGENRDGTDLDQHSPIIGGGFRF